MVARPAPRPLLTMLIHNHHFYTGVQEELGGLFPVELRMAFITTSTYTDYRRGVQPFYVVRGGQGVGRPSCEEFETGRQMR
jgi:hypothetical protein